MGRITIFSVDECPHCKRTKQAFKERGIPYLEISLTKHPKKKNDMLSLSDRLTVPQIFFNEKHIGGADDTLKVIKEWDDNSHKSTPLQMYEREVGKYDDPTDPRLQPSTDAPVVEKPPPTRQPYVIQVPQSKKGRDNNTAAPTTTSPKKQNKALSVLEMTELLKRALPRRSLKHKVTVYKKSFTGRDLIDALVKEFDITRIEAVKFGKYIQNEHQIVHHVVKDHKKVDDTKDLFFRLHCDQTPAVLNSYCVWTERVDPDAMGLLKRLKKQLNTILGDHTDSDGKVNYLEASKHKDFPAFEEASCELQGVDVEAMSSDMKLAFSINLYNLAIKFAFTKLGIGTDSVGRNAFFNNVAIQIGGSYGKVHTLSVQDLENGILRGNRKAPYTLSKPFSSNDERLNLVMPTVDNRIHFGLNCGASSCPPVKNFTVDGVNEELRIVAQAFCEDENNVRFDSNTNTLYLNKILYWYGVDFGGSSDEVAKTILTFLRGKKRDILKKAMSISTIKVKYNDYDWGTDACDDGYVPFTANSIKPNVTSFFY
jgi:glutaredoxin